jgi:hypothetical protein
MKNTHNDSINDKWESRELGATEKYVKKLSQEEELVIDDALGLQVVSIRLQKKLIAAFKAIAKDEGIGYQPLMRQVLTHYVRDYQSNHLKRAK